MNNLVDNDIFLYRLDPKLKYKCIKIINNQNIVKLSRLFKSKYGDYFINADLTYKVNKQDLSELYIKETKLTKLLY